MKKRIYLSIILIFVFFLLLQITILANEVLLPKHNVATTTTNISIFDNGEAIINLRYVGYPEITSGAKITIKIERKESALIWKEIASRDYYTNDVYHVNRFQHYLDEMGTYRFTIIYHVSGNAGKDDTVKIREEKIYDETAPEMPLLRSGEDYDHDCTSANCCEYCYKLLDATALPSHRSDGNWLVYDDEYHDSGCANHTVSSAVCLQRLKEKHRFDEDLVCKICGYKKMTFTEVLDEENKCVTLTVFVDGLVSSNLPLAWLEEEAYEIVEKEYMSFVVYHHIDGAYTIHIPLSEYESCKQTGIEFWVHSQKRKFCVCIYPTLEIE